ncbi:multicopper oxidase-domain-containing protein [Aspergillus ambiguus]|uniref:laccase abr2 n=1 Tax=Aspergillus ambiguus TaxID=176160 RepID=UPI003CCE107E
MGIITYPSFFLFSALAFVGFVSSAQVHFSLELSWGKGSPNGVTRDMIFVNNQFPGPELIMDEGDDVIIDVLNRLPVNTSIHFHGIEQKDTPWSDGVAGLTQWAIMPGQTYQYRWRANTYGTYWYHAHDRSTIMDGLYGAIRIRPSEKTSHPFGLISDNSDEIQSMKYAERHGELVVLSDWDHLTSEEYMDALKDTGYDIFCSDSVLVNGRGRVFCDDPENLTQLMKPVVRNFINSSLTDKGCLPFLRPLQGDWEHHPDRLPVGLNSGCIPTIGSEVGFDVDPADNWVSFHFISAASLKVLVVSIDEHPMYVYEVDGRYIEPQLVHSITMYSGERYSVMVKLDKEPAIYKLRVANDGNNQIISGFASIRYKGGELSLRPSTPYINYGGSRIFDNTIELDRQNLPPYPAISPTDVPDDTHFLTLGRINSSWEWTLDGTSFLPINLDEMEPVILNPESPQLATALKIATKNDTWVDIIFQLRVDEVTPLQPPHPIHKHSNKAFYLGGGSGKFRWESVQSAMIENPENFLARPFYRDTFVTSAVGESWMAIRYHVQNPGPFLIHCHTETHLRGGMGLVLLDGVDVWPSISDEGGKFSQRN